MLNPPILICLSWNCLFYSHTLAWQIWRVTNRVLIWDPSDLQNGKQMRVQWISSKNSSVSLSFWTHFIFPRLSKFFVTAVGRSNLHFPTFFCSSVTCYILNLAVCVLWRFPDPGWLTNTSYQTHLALLFLLPRAESALGRSKLCTF